MRFFYLIITIIFLISCGSSETIYDESVSKQVHVFKNNDFKIQYPKDWEIFDSLQKGKQNFRITPSKEIAKGYRYLDYANGRVDTVRRKYRDDVPVNKNLQIIEENVDITSTYVYVVESQLSGQSHRNFLDEKLKMFDDEPNFEIELKRISDNFYIVKLYNKMYSKENGYRFASSRYKIYSKSSGNKVYDLVYYAPEYLYPEYIEDANYILRSFKIL